MSTPEDRARIRKEVRTTAFRKLRGLCYQLVKVGQGYSMRLLAKHEHLWGELEASFDAVRAELETYRFRLARKRIISDLDSYCYVADVIANIFLC